MAATLRPDGTTDKAFVSFPIVKFEKTDDGDLVVYGKATDGSVDSDEQIVDPAWSGPALKQWLETGGNVRVQHNPSLYPAGKGLTVEETPDGHYVKSLVVEPTAKRLVQAGVLQAYSVGIARPQVERDITGKARGGIIRGGELFELSLVDRPANKNCSITLSKSEGELVKSEDGTDTTVWTEGDLEGALAAAEVATKSASVDLAAEYTRERTEWLAAEPSPADATQGPEYMAKRAEWQNWLAKGESEGLAEGGHSLWLTKRQQAANVGGGVDRDKIPATDFAGRDRSFPIVTPGDVQDAASSIGRAGADNYSADQLRENITSIAHRKGPEFVSQLPDAWRETADATKSDKPAYVIGADLGHGHTAEIPIHHKDDDGDDNSEPQVPPAAGGQHQAPPEQPPSGGVSGDSYLGDASSAEYVSDKMRMCPNCAHDQVQHDDAFCSKCGYGMGTMKESEGAPVAAPAEQQAPPPVADHQQAPPPPPHHEAPKADLPPYSVKRMHDALCAAYHTDAVEAAYPSLKSFQDAVDPAQVESGAYKALAEALKAADPAMAADARAEVHKSFTDMYPKEKLSPSDPPRPGSYQRTYLSSGHAKESASGGNIKLPPGGRQISADDYDRGPLTAGQEDASPANKGDGNNPISSTATGSGRDLYAAATREYTANTIKALHDHITGGTAELCPMSPSPSLMPPDNGADAMPKPVKPLDTESGAAPATKSSADTLTIEDVQRMVDVAVKTATKATKKKYKSQISALQAELDELGRQPDPTQAPVRGVVRKAAGADAAPVDRRSLAIEAQDRAKLAEKAAYVNYLQNLAQSGDPDTREKAYKALAIEGIADPFAS